MTKQELRQVYRINSRINAKLEQIERLRELATMTTPSLVTKNITRIIKSKDKDVEDKKVVENCIIPNTNSGNQSNRIEDCISKIDELEREINAEIDTLVDVTRSVKAAINAVEDDDYKLLLELRYLNFKTWEEIAVEMGFSWRHTLRIHSRALQSIKDVIECHI